MLALLILFFTNCKLHIFQSFELFAEIHVLWIFQTIFQVVSQRDDTKNIFALQIIIFFQVIEQCFFVTDKMVELQMIMHLLITF